MWNSLSLNPPPINSFNAKTTSIDLKAVIILLENGMKLLDTSLNKALHIECKLLSRCIYRMKLQFRNDKGFKFAQKTNSLLRKFLDFDIVKDINYFYKSVPKKYVKNCYLPTKQMLEYVLVRLQGYVQFTKRIAESAINTAKLMNCRLGLGQLWSTAAIVLGLVSRIWQICKYLTKQCCILYNDLLPLRDKLNLVGMKWLEDDYEFPEDLIKWLDVEWLYDRVDVISQVQLELPIFNLLEESDDEDVQYCYQYKLNDCVIIDDDNPDKDDDVQIIQQFSNVSNLNKKEHLEYIIDNSDESISCIEIDDSSINEEGVSQINKTTDDSSDIIEIPLLNDNDDDIGEKISRDSSLIIKKDKKLRKKKKKKLNQSQDSSNINLNIKSGKIKKKKKKNVDLNILKEKVIKIKSAKKKAKKNL